MGGSQPRRIPRQARSRERVERLLDSASELVMSQGVEGVTTRSIADLADLPVASLYQYFADKESILLAICERAIAEMDEQVALDVAALPALSLASLIEAAMGAHLTVFRHHPAFMRIWLRGRTNMAIYDYGHRHNREIAARMLALATSEGLVSTTVYGDNERAAIAEFAAEMADHGFQLAFERDARGDDFLIGQAISMVSDFVQRLGVGLPGGERAAL